MHTYGEFHTLQELIQGMPGGPRVNLKSDNENVPDIKQRIRVFKERSRATRHIIPFNRMPKIDDDP